MNKFFILIISLFLCLPAFAENTLLTGGVVYTVETARKAAFENIQLKIDKKILEPHLYDENNKANLYALKNNIQPKDRTIIAFEMAKGFVNGYAIVYNANPDYTYYYSIGGYLVAVDIDNKPQETSFPYKVGKYNPITGNLISVSLYVSDEEQYAYTKSGKLKAHWIGEFGYNSKGKIIAKRKYTDVIPE